MRKSLPLLLFALLLLAPFCADAALNGGYTIGAGPASATNYATFGSAVSDMVSGVRADGGPVNGPAVSGPVVFTVSAGTYNERISIPAITGASATNTITFDGVDPMTRTITWTSTASGDYTVQLNGADYIRLNNLGIANPGATYGYGVQLLLSADNNNISGCRIVLPTNSTSSTKLGVIAGTTYTVLGLFASNLTLQNNTIIGGYISAVVNGPSGTQATGLNMTNNTFTDAYYSGIYLQYINLAVVQGNAITMRTGNASSYGAQLRYCSQYAFSRNRILNPGTYGLYLFNTNFNMNNPATVANNMIGGGFQTTGTSYGIYATTNRFLNLYHNSVLCDNATGTGARALYVLGTSNDLDIRNNVFASTNTSATAGYAAYITTMSWLSFMDYNDYYSAGTNLCYLQANYTTLAAMQTAWPSYNAMSQSVWPNFLSATDLHTYGIPLSNWAFDITTVTQDYDGDTRPLAPDIIKDCGADEFNLPLVDLDIVQVVSPVVPIVGSNPVQVQVQTNGSTSLNGSPFTMQYSTDGGLTWPVSQTFTPTTLGSPGAQETFTFTTPWNITAAGSYNFCVRISPSLVGDPDPTDQVCGLYCTGMTGVYTLNSGLPTGGTNYNNFTDLANALNGCGIAGPVTVNVAPGLYVETITLNTITGTSATNTVTIDGADTSLVTLGYNHTTANASVVTLNGADYVTFRRMKILSTGGTYGSCVKLTNQADNNTLDRCVMIMPSASTSAYHIGVLASGTTYTTYGDNANYTTVTNCNIRGGYYGLRLLGTNTTTYCTGNRVLNSYLSDFYYYGLYSYYQQDNEYVGNRIVQRSTGVFSTAGYGIYSYYSQRNFKLDYNTIHTIGTYGIYSSNGNANNSGKGSISNNMIGGNWLTTGSAYCVYMINNRDIDFYHNSLSLNGNNGYAVYVSGTPPTSDSLRFVNNIFGGHGYAMGVGGRAFYVVNPGCIQRMNHNLYSGGAQIVYWGGTTYNSLPAFQSGVPQFNANSLFDDPGFISNVNLHLICSPVDNLGTPLGFTTDIDGQGRSLTTPDIGADEFSGIAVSTSLGPDIAVCGGTTLYADTVNFESYYWGGGQATNFLPVDTTGSYSIFVIDSNNCRARDTIFVTVDSFPTVPYGNDTVSGCAGYVLDAGNPGTTYLWNTGANTQTISPTASGNYTVTVTTTAGCAITDTVRLELFANPTVELGPDTTFCLGSGTLLDAGAGPTGTTYQWSTGAATQIIVPSSPGMYRVTVTSPQGCQGTDSVTLNILLSPAVNLGPNRTECGPFTLDAQNPGNTYQWNTGATSQTIGSSVGGTFSVTVTNSVGCSTSDVVTITVSNPPTVNLGPDLILCDGQTLTLDAGNTGFQYLWSTGATSQTIVVINPGTYIVGVTNPGTGCRGSDTILISQSFLSVDLGPDRTICPGEVVTLDAGAMPTNYTWSTGANTQTIQVTTPGTVGVTVSDNLGCVVNDQIVLTAGAAPTAAYTPASTSIPLFQTLQFTDNSVGATGWEWDFGDGGTSTQQNPSYSWVAIGTYNVCLTATNGTCTNTACQTITVGPPVDVEEGDLAQGVVLYPNPNGGVFSLDFDLTKSLDLEIDVLSLAGQSVAHRSLRAVRYQHEEFDLQQLSKGMYFLRMQSTKGDVWIKKVVIE